MARIELRDAVVNFKDGLSGTAAHSSTPMSGDTTSMVTSVVLNTAVTNKVPVGARFTIAGESSSTIHTVTARSPASSAPTTSITYTPALGSGTYAMGAVFTFLPQLLSIKTGDGDVKYTENVTYIYDLDRGLLDDVRQGDDVPMDVNFSIVYEHITTGTSETIAPMDALKQTGSASEWVTSASDQCEPYAIDVEVVVTAPCGNTEGETTVFPDFRADKKEISYKDATITLTGKCNATEPIVTRATPPNQ